jgi:hypothetical protein
MNVAYGKTTATSELIPGGLKGNSMVEPPRSKTLKHPKNSRATGTNLRWVHYAVTGLVFGVLDWFYLIWLTFDIRQALTLNPTLEKGLLTLLNFGIWLVPIVPIVIIESRKALNAKGPAYAGMLTWCAAILSYYGYYALLLSFGKLPGTNYLDVLGSKYDGFWHEYWLKLRYLILEQVLEWLPIALIGGAALGILAWELTHKRQKTLPEQEQAK